MFTKILSEKETPKHICHDNDPLFHSWWWQSLMGVIFYGEEENREIWTVPYTPVSNPFVERLIGSIRREYLDHIPFLTQDDLENKLLSYKKYYNAGRVHRSLEGKIPNLFADEKNVITADFNTYTWESYCNGMFKTPVAA